MTDVRKVAVIGGGLAGCEAAQMLARRGAAVDLFEMRPGKSTPAHSGPNLGELVCSNSLGRMDVTSAGGLLKREMRLLGSFVLKAADEASVPAGAALGVDRERYSAALTRLVSPLVRLHRKECTSIPEGYDAVVVATGPLTSDAMAGALVRLIGRESLYFYDAVSPIVTAESVDMSGAYFRDRYGSGEGDYLNCPLDQETYESFVAAVLSAEKAPIRPFEAMRCFEACMPIEELAARGLNTLAFGAMKPVGLEDPRTGRRPHAVVQLRRENDPTTLFNLVGFQTRLKHGEQKRVFAVIPALRNAKFARFGSVHRNTYIESPSVLRDDFRLMARPDVFVAGQLSGVEGYMESAATGLWVGLAASSKEPVVLPPPDTAMGALLRAATSRPPHGVFSPVNMNFGILPPADCRGAKDVRRQAIVERACASFEAWLSKTRSTERLPL